MRYAALPIVSAALMLSACQTSSLTDAERAPVPETDEAFSGEIHQIDREQSSISFVGKSNLLNHEGKFTDYSADVTLDPADPADLEKASITASVQIASVETDAPGLDGHLQKDDFFAAELYPAAHFSSTSITRIEGNTYMVTGDLTVRDTTKEISFEAEITNAGISAQFDFPRAEFGIGNESYGEKLLEPTVPVNVKIVFVQ